MNPPEPIPGNESKKDRSDPDAVRQSFRVPVDSRDGICAVLNEKIYPVTDMNPEGVSIVCTGPDELGDSELIDGCRLELSEDHIPGLTARIIHRTHGSGKAWNIGLKWVAPDDGTQEKLAAAVSKIKQKLQKQARE